MYGAPHVPGGTYPFLSGTIVGEHVGRARVMVLAGIVTWALVSPGRVTYLVVRKSIAVAVGRNVDSRGYKVWVLGAVGIEAGMFVARGVAENAVQ